mmetsp:Transcript_8902/g.19266  ORF Transcript_8902/g.19266 Transcript_8902/m.19266 type:complete len:83 (-) Transcript_8902:648-896(-)
MSTIDIDKNDPHLRDFFFKDDDLIDYKVKMIVRLPVRAPAHFGFTLKTGTVDQGLFDGLDLIDDEYLTSWTILINNHDQALQ